MVLIAFFIFYFFSNKSLNLGNNYIYLNLDNLTRLEGVIYDLKGQVIKSFRNENQIYVGNLTNGVYIIEIRADGNLQTFKLIKE
jgi:hypothetical protein